MRSYWSSAAMAGCSSPAAQIDAAAGKACGAVETLPIPAGCVPDGLAALDLAGTWSFAGTFVDYDGYHRDFTVPAQLDRYFAGYCGFSLTYSLAFEPTRTFDFADDGSLTTYVDNTLARAGTNVICATDATSLSLTYSDEKVVGEGPEFRRIDGALVR